MNLRPYSKRSLMIAGGLALSALGDRETRAYGAERASPSIDHSAFDVLLRKYARMSQDRIVRVDYGGWSHASNDRAALRRYIAALSASHPDTLSRDEQFAFWSNLYNAATLNLILQVYPVRSIRDIRPSSLAFGPWKQKVVEVAGVELSLDAIEHDILRKGWRDPRVHYAINCASISCPNLPLRAWRAEGLWPALDAAGRAYVNSSRGVRFDGKALVVSSIYKWYADDFGGTDARVIAHLANLAAEPLRTRLHASRRIARDSYDWSLNLAAAS